MSNKIDFAGLKDRVDLVALLSRYTTLKRVGTEHHGPCPFCHGDDRFIVIPQEQRWFCRQGGDHCGRSGDAIDFIKEAEGLDTVKAVEYLSNGYLTHGDPVKPIKSSKDRTPTYVYDWTEQKRKLLDSHKELLANKLAITDAVSAYLTGRGITEDTIKAFSIGWEDKRLADSKQTALAVALPWFDQDGNLFAIKFRYLEPQTYIDDTEAAKPNPKPRTETKTSRGSTKGQVFGWQVFRPSAETLVIVEGEFNALSLWQATPHAVLSLGSRSAFGSLPDTVKTLASQFKQVIVWADEQEDSAKAAIQLPGALILVSQTVAERKMDANACLVAGTLLDVLTTAEAPKPEQAEPRYTSYPYTVNVIGQMCYVQTRTNEETGEEKDTVTPLANFAARITKELTGEFGEKFFTIEGKGVRGKAFTLEIAGEDFGDTGKLCAKLEAAAGRHDGILPNQRAHIGPAIKALTDETSIEKRVYHRTGWTTLDGKPCFLIPGREPEGVEIKLAERLPYAFDPKADLAKGLQCLDHALKFTEDKGTIILAAALLPPLAYHADLRSYRYTLYLRGRTGAYKTATMKLFMCLYGAKFASDDFLIRLGGATTPNALMSMATQVSDLPLLIDNYKPNTGGGSKELINVIHTLTEGGEKDRLSRASVLNQHKSIWAYPFVTGEDIPREDAAALARTLILLFKRLEPAESKDMARLDHLTQAQALSRHLNAVGAAWIDWLVTPEAQEIIAGCDFEAERRNYTRLIAAEHPGAVNPSRIATSLALNHLVWTILTYHPTLGEFARQHEQAHDTALADLIRSTVETTTHALEADRLLDYLREYIGGGRLTLLPKGEEIVGSPQEREHTIGWHDGDGGAYVLPDLTIQMVKRYSEDSLSGLTKPALFEQLDHQGMIYKGKDKNGPTSTKVIYVGGHSKRVLHLRAAALAEEPEG